MPTVITKENRDIHAARKPGERRQRPKYNQARRRALRSYRWRQVVGNLMLLAADIAALVVIYRLAGEFRMELSHWFSFYTPYRPRFEATWWFLPVWLTVLTYLGGYTKKFTFWDEVKLTWQVAALSTVAVLAILFIAKQSAQYSRTVVIGMFFIGLLVFPVFRLMAKKLLHKTGLRKRRILIIGAGKEGRQALCALSNEPNLGYEVVAFVDDDYAHFRELHGIRVLRHTMRAGRYLTLCNIQDVLISKPDLRNSRLARLINSLQHKALATLYVPDMQGVAVLGMELRHFFNEQSIVLEVRNNLENPFSYALKRSFDYAASVLLLPPLLPLMLVIAAAIRLSSRGSVLFRQERLGHRGRVFTCLKFRTMYADADERLEEILENDPRAKAEWEMYWKLKEDPRVTPVGRFLRQTSLDELPQLFNVLRGEMSLIGPRPYLPRERDFLAEHADLILSLPPGVTGLWQVSGRNRTSYDRRLLLDSWYVRNWNLWLDVVTLLRTATVILKREGAY